MRRFLPFVLPLLSLVIAGCAGTGSNFSLLPRSLQKNPAGQMTVITEMTPEGQRMTPPAADQPERFAIQSIGYHDEGMAFGKDRAMPLPAVQSLLLQALAGQHLLLADGGHSAGLVMVFTCGSANTVDNRTSAGFATGSGLKAPTASAAFPTASPQPSDFDAGTDVPEPPADVTGQTDYATRKNFLSRAALVGGDAFARDLATALNQEDEFVRSGSGLATANPLELLENKSAKNRQLVDAARDDRYYVVVSAYAAHPLANGRPQLLWRTKMTTASEGVTMAATLPTLIRQGAPYLGATMAEAAILPETSQ